MLWGHTVPSLLRTLCGIPAQPGGPSGSLLYLTHRGPRSLEHAPSGEPAAALPVPTPQRVSSRQLAPSQGRSHPCQIRGVTRVPHCAAADTLRLNTLLDRLRPATDLSNRLSCVPTRHWHVPEPVPHTEVTTPGLRAKPEL